jgi:LAGLIDADG DNA endonuclease family
LTKLSSSQLDGAIYGALLGDASLSRPKQSANSNFTLTHSPKQIEYLEFKKDLFSQIHPLEFKFKKIEFYNKKAGKTYTTFYYYTNYTQYLTKLRHKFYPNETKTVNYNILNKLTPLGLAIWWMDDGSLVVYKRKDRNAVNRYATLATCSFSLEEHLIIINYFKHTWDISPKLVKRRQYNKEYYVLMFPMKQFTKFVEIIKPYIIPSMNYKIDFKYVNQNLSV